MKLQFILHLLLALTAWFAPLVAAQPYPPKFDDARAEIYMPTVLAVAGAAPPPGLAGRSFVPLLRAESADWRQYLFTEFHTHAARTNYYPQRTVCSDRYKLIENLLPGTVNPGYEFTNDGHLEANLEATIAAAPPNVRAAYDRMRQPPRWELYDLQADPYEFHDLAADPKQANVFAELQRELARWRAETADPLLKPENLARLTKEVTSASKQEARALSWNYPYYFFDHEPPTRNAPAAESQGRKKRKSK